MYLKDKAIEIKTAQCFTPVSQAEIFLVNDTDFRSIRLLKGCHGQQLFEGFSQQTNHTLDIVGGLFL